VGSSRRLISWRLCDDRTSRQNGQANIKSMASRLLTFIVLRVSTNSQPISHSFVNSFIHCMLSRSVVRSMTDAILLAAESLEHLYVPPLSLITYTKGPCLRESRALYVLLLSFITYTKASCSRSQGSSDHLYVTPVSFMIYTRLTKYISCSSFFEQKSPALSSSVFPFSRRSYEVFFLVDSNSSYMQFLSVPVRLGVEDSFPAQDDPVPQRLSAKRPHPSNSDHHQ
jgi:hypothetical protein